MAFPLAGGLPSLTNASRADSGSSLDLSGDFIVGGQGRSAVSPWVWGAGLAVAAAVLLKLVS